MKNRIYKNNNENKAFDNPWTALKSEQIHFYPIFSNGEPSEHRIPMAVHWILSAELWSELWAKVESSYLVGTFAAFAGLTIKLLVLLKILKVYLNMA